MKISYDKKADEICFTSSEKGKVVESEQVESGIILDLDENQQVIGVEILDASRRIKSDEIEKVLIDVA